MKSSLILCLLFMLVYETFAQDRRVFVKDDLYFVPDKQFRWLTNNTCQADPVIEDLHKKVDVKPVLLQFSRVSFEE